LKRVSYAKCSEHAQACEGRTEESNQIFNIEMQTALPMLQARYKNLAWRVEREHAEWAKLKEQMNILGRTCARLEMENAALKTIVQMQHQTYDGNDLANMEQQPVAPDFIFSAGPSCSMQNDLGSEVIMARQGAHN
jgi:hypothetical protein